MLKKTSNILWKTLVALLTVLVFVLATPWGARFAIHFANQADILAIDYSKGSLVNGMHLNNVTISLDNQKIVINDAVLKLKLSCVFNSELCVQSVHGESFFYQLTTPRYQELTQQEQQLDDLAKVEESLDGDLIDIPYFYIIRDLSFKSVIVEINDLKIEVDNFTSSADIGGELVSLGSTSASRVFVNIKGKKESESAQESAAAVEDWALANLPTISIPLDLRISKLSAQSVDVIIDDLSISSPQIDAAFNWLLDDVNIKNLGLSGLKIRNKDSSDSAIDYEGFLTSKGELVLTSPYKTTLDIIANAQLFSRFSDVNGSQLSLDISGDFSALSAKAVGSGNISTNAEIAINLIDKNLPFNGTVELNRYPFPQELLSTLTPENISIKVAGNKLNQSVSGSSVFSIQEYEHSQLTFELDHQDRQLNIKKLTIENEQKKSDISVDGTLSYGNTIAWNTNLSSTGLKVPNIANEIYAELVGSIEGSFTTSGSLDLNSEKWAVKLSDAQLSGFLHDLPVSLIGDLGIDQALNLSQSDVNLTAFGTTLQLKGFSNDSWHVTARLTSTDLEHLTPELTGSFDANIDVSGEKSSPQISLDANITDFIAEIGEDSDFRTEHITIVGDYFPTNKHQFSFDTKSEKLSYQNMDFSDFVSTFSGDIQSQRLELNWLGDIEGELALSNKLNVEDKRFETSINKSKFKAGEFVFEPNKKIEVTTVPQQKVVGFNAHCWSTTGADLCFEKDALIGATGDIFAKIYIDAAELNEHVSDNSILINSALNGIVQATWKANQLPKLKAEIDVTKGDITHAFNEDVVEMVKWNEGKFILSLADEAFKSELKLLKEDNSSLIDAQADIDLTKENAMSGFINIAELNLRPLRALIPSLEELDATLESNIELAGTLSDPDISGDVALKDGKISIVRSQAKIDSINLKSSFRGERAVLSGELFIDDQPATFSGDVDWRTQFLISANIFAENLPLSFAPNLDIHVAPNVNILYKKDTLDIKGSIDVLDGRLAIDQLPEGTINVSDDVIIVNEEGIQITQEQRLAITTNLDISIADKFKLEGYGFNGNLSGNLQVRQSPFQPLNLFGLLSVTNGYYKAYGQNLEVTTGKVNFNGAVDNPYVDFKAQRYIKSDDVNVGITITGLLDSIHLDLFSTPHKEQSEILSYLIRGRGIDEGTGSNAALGLALGTSLTKASNVNKLLEQLPIFDNIALDTEMDGDNALATISGYIGDRIYMKYGVGIDNPVDEVTVRFYLLNKLWLESVSGLEKSFDIYYSFDVD